MPCESLPGSYLASLEPDAERAAQAVRQHWGVENSLHWVLDVAFREDESRVRVGDASARCGSPKARLLCIFNDFIKLPACPYRKFHLGDEEPVLS